jgi:hypothetical protein
MSIRRIAIGTVVAALLALAACATSPADEQRRKDMEADIDEILTYELDKTEFEDPGRCLRESQYRSFRPLGDRHLLFEGRNGKQWINVLHGRCVSLDDDTVFVMHLTSSGRVCDKDRFEAVDRMALGAGMGPVCVFGEFKPVAKAQVQEIEARLEAR